MKWRNEGKVDRKENKKIESNRTKLTPKKCIREHSKRIK